LTNVEQPISWEAIQLMPEAKRPIIKTIYVSQDGVDVAVERMTFTAAAFFDSDQEIPVDSSKPLIGMIASYLRNRHPSAAITISGHTDAIGSDEYNNTLSIHRAQNVAVAIGKSDGPTSLYVIGMGKRQPIAPNDNEAGRAQNRRVEVYVSSDSRANVKAISSRSVVAADFKTADNAYAPVVSLSMPVYQIVGPNFTQFTAAGEVRLAPVMSVAKPPASFANYDRAAVKPAQPLTKAPAPEPVNFREILPPPTLKQVLPITASGEDPLAPVMADAKPPASFANYDRAADKPAQPLTKAPAPEPVTFREILPPPTLKQVLSTEN
jgi:outer membrane protein OmpA-like peptidoglycan-associated protein